MRGRTVAVVLALTILLAIPPTAFAADPAPAAMAPAEAATAPPKPLGVGDVVTDLKGKALDGKEWDLNKLDKKAILVFMNTACSACQYEMAEIHKLSLKNKDQWYFLSVSVDIMGERTIPGFAEQNKFNTTYILDPDFVIAGAFGISSTPAAVILDKGGKILYKKSGFMKSKAGALIAEMDSNLK